MPFPPLALLLLSLTGCVEPPVLDAVSKKLAAADTETAGPEIRLLTGIAGVLAESCSVVSLSGYTFVGGAASALGVTEAAVETSESGNHTWTFTHIGVDGADGTLAVTTDTERTSFTATYNLTGTIVSGGFKILSCSTSAPTDSGDTARPDSGGDTAGNAGAPADTYTATVSGNLDFSIGTGGNHVQIEGTSPDVSLAWVPVTAAVPTAGWVHWYDTIVTENAQDQIILEDAESIDYTDMTWPGSDTAVDSRGNTIWTHHITIGLP